MKKRNCHEDLKTKGNLGGDGLPSQKIMVTAFGFLMVTVLSAVTVDATIAKMVLVLPDWVGDLAGCISASTDPLVIVPLMAGAVIAGRSFRALSNHFDFITSLFKRSVLAVGVATLLKCVIGRARPNESAIDPLVFNPFAAQDMFAASPSAQATLSAAIGFSLAMRFPKVRLLVLAGTIAVCLSRILVGEHWTSDVIFGWALGWGLATARWRRNACAFNRLAS